MAGGLTNKQQRFVDEYIVDLNATQAAIRAGYSAKTAAQQGERLLRNVEVRRAVDEALEERADRVNVKADDVLRELLRIATTDLSGAYDEHGRLLPLKDIPRDLRRAIAGVETEELWGAPEDGERSQIGTTRKLKLWDKTKALELLGKHLKLFTDKVEHSASDSLEALILASYAKEK